jgi:hypothetical protein
MTAQDARRAATIELGRADTVAERVRDARAGAFLDTIARDVRYGLRLLARTPWFTLTAALSLGVCIAANTTVFTLVNRLLLREAHLVADPARHLDRGEDHGWPAADPGDPRGGRGRGSEHAGGR